MDNGNGWHGILVHLEWDGNNLAKISKELISEAYRLSKQYEQPIYGVAVGKGTSKIKDDVKSLPVKSVFLYETDKPFQADLYEKAVCDCIHKIKPSVVLIGGTNEGRALAPRIAVTFRTGLTADCTELEMTSKGELVQIRPAFGGNIMARIVTEKTRPQMATVRPNVMELINETFSFPIQFHEMTMPEYKSQIQVTQMWHLKEEGGISSQNILVVAGRGMKKREDLNMLRELAKVLGGGLASSRALVEKGWMNAAQQIGLSGQTVKPEYMITCGVSGTIQFVSGMRQTKHIIAINTDPDAEILKIAHYPICADLYEAVPELIKLQKKR